MNAQADNARRDLVDQTGKALFVLRGKLMEQAETARAHEQFAKQTLQALGKPGVDDFKRRRLIGVWPQYFNRDLERLERLQPACLGSRNINDGSLSHPGRGANDTAVDEVYPGGIQNRRYVIRGHRRNRIRVEK